MEGSVLKPHRLRFHEQPHTLCLPFPLSFPTSSPHTCQGMGSGLYHHFRQTCCIHFWHKTAKSERVNSSITFAPNYTSPYRMRKLSSCLPLQENSCLRTACLAEQLSSCQEAFHSKKFLSYQELLYEVGIQETEKCACLWVTQLAITTRADLMF